jgi:hypothetical protein
MSDIFQASAGQTISAAQSLTGGNKGQTLCARVAAAFGQRCMFCRLIGAALRGPTHCADQLLRWRAAILQLDPPKRS